MTDNRLDSALSELKAMERAARQARERFSRLKRVQKGAVLVVAVMSVWLCYHLFADGWVAREFHHQSGGGTMQTMVVATHPISQEISLTGSLEPFKTVNIPAPFTGPVRKVAFSYGEEVKRGQVLLVLDDSDLMIKLRNAESDYIKAGQEFDNTSHWSQSTESRDAQRDLISARNSAFDKKRKLEEAQALFKDGIISRNDMEQAQEDYRSAKDALASSQDKYKAELKKGGHENVRMAEIKLKNAQAVFESYKARAAQATVSAPVRGVVMKPPAVRRRQVHGHFGRDQRHRGNAHARHRGPRIHGGPGQGGRSGRGPAARGPEGARHGRGVSRRGPGRGHPRHRVPDRADERGKTIPITRWTSPSRTFRRTSQGPCASA